jgi:hypothetical protein
MWRIGGYRPGVDTERARVTDLIRTAFAGVRLGGGVGLRQGDALDDYALPEVVQRQRVLDEKEDWWAIAPADLATHHASLSYFDAEGMRFHLPAFLMDALSDGRFAGSVVFALTQGDRKEAFGLLSAAQRGAVREFLAFLATDPEYAFDRADIEHAIATFWSGNTAT